MTERCPETNPRTGRRCIMVPEHQGSHHSDGHGKDFDRWGDANSEAVIEPGLYLHHKGGRYRVLMLATESTNARVGTPVVVYISLTTGDVHTRDFEEWREPVPWPDGETRPRFAKCVGYG